MVLPNVSPGDPHAVAHNTERAEINKLVQGVNLPSRTSDRAFFPITKALSDGTARIVALGDSKTEGTGLERTTHRWLNKLQAHLRDLYGKSDTGYGYMPAKFATFYDFQDGPVYEGTVTAFDSQTHGLGQRIAKLELGSTVTFPSMTFADGVPLTVHYIETGIYPAGEIEVLTDGVVRGTIATSGTGFSSQKATVSIPAGDAQVVLRPKAGTNPVYVEGIFNETSTSGIKVIDGSKSGAKFSQFNESASWNAVGMYEPHGYILAFGANDMSEKTPAQMAVDARAIVTRALNLSPLAGVVILHGSERTQTPQSGKVREFETVMRTEFADDPQVSILYESDLWLPKTGTDYTWGGPEGWLVDTVHTSAFAHSEIARYLANKLSPAVSVSSGGSGGSGSTTRWNDIQGKPGTYPPSYHDHSWDDVAGKPSTFPPESHSHAWNDVTNKPTSFPPSTHTHDAGSIGAVPASRFLTGTGSPQGVVTAPVGTEYIDTAGTNGARKWYKDKGTGNTGWIVIFGDTGVRNVSSLLINGWAPSNSDRWTMRRMNNMVFIGGYITGPSSTSDNIMSPLPSGFYGYDTTGSWREFSSSSGKGGVILVQRGSGGVITLRDATGGVNIFASVSYQTTDDWPTSLPGAPA